MMVLVPADTRVLARRKHELTIINAAQMRFCDTRSGCVGLGPRGTTVLASSEQRGTDHKLLRCESERPAQTASGAPNEHYYSTDVLFVNAFRHNKSHRGLA